MRDAVPFRWPLAAPAPLLEVRYFKLIAACIAEWPTALPEAWPLLVILLTTPPDHTVVLYTDSLSVIQIYERLVLGPPLTDVQKLDITDRWLWYGALMPLARQRLEAGRAIVLHHVRSHVREKGLIQKLGYTLVNETADVYAEKGRKRGIEIDLAPYMDAWAPTYSLTYQDIALRDRPVRLLKKMDQDRRVDAITALPKEGWFLNLAPYLDMQAARGALDTHWVPFAPYLPPDLFASQAHAYTLRFGHLPTTLNLMRSYEAPHGYGWLRDALVAEANERGLPAGDRWKGEAAGPANTCPLCCHGEATVSHALSECPATKAAAYEGLRRFWTLLTGLGRPGILFGQGDEADGLRTCPEFQTLIEANSTLHWCSENQGPTRVRWDSDGMQSFTLRADAYASLERRYSQGVEGGLLLPELFKQSVGLVVNPDTSGATSPILMSRMEVVSRLGPAQVTYPPVLPSALLNWVSEAFSIADSWVPEGTLASTLGAFTMYRIPDAPHLSPWAHINTAPITVRALQARPHFLHAWALPLDKAKVVLDLVGKACRTAWKPFRLVAFLPDDPAILKWARKQQGVMVLSLPRKRLPWVSPARWLRGCSYVARDMAWCQSPGLRVVVWENSSAPTKWPVLPEITMSLRDICRDELRGGAHELKFRYQGVTTLLSPTMPPRLIVDYDKEGRVTCLGSLALPADLAPLLALCGAWLGQPCTGAHAVPSWTPAANQRNPNLTGFWGPGASTKFTVSLGQMEGQDLARAYCAAAPPKGFTTFLRDEMGSTDAKRDGQMLVATLAAAHLATWTVYKEAQDRRLLIAYRKMGFTEPPTYLSPTSPKEEPSLIRTPFALTIPCEGPQCKGGVCPASVQTYGLATQTVTCAACHTLAARCRLLVGMAAACAHPALHQMLRGHLTPSPVPPLGGIPAPALLPRLLTHVASLGPTLTVQEVALGALYPENVFQELKSSRPATLSPVDLSDYDPLVWVIYLCHHKRLQAAAKVLWRTIPLTHRPLLPASVVSLWGLLTAAQHVPVQDCVEPPEAEVRRCAGRICCSLKASRTSPVWRPLHKAHLCSRCTQHYNGVQDALFRHAATKQARKVPLDPALHTAVGRLAAGLTQPQVIKALMESLQIRLSDSKASSFILAAHYNIHQGTSALFVQEHSLPGSPHRFNPIMAPPWWRQWQKDHPLPPLIACTARFIVGEKRRRSALRPPRISRQPRLTTKRKRRAARKAGQSPRPHETGVATRPSLSFLLPQPRAAGGASSMAGRHIVGHPSWSGFASPLDSHSLPSPCGAATPERPVLGVGNLLMRSRHAHWGAIAPLPRVTSRLHPESSFVLTPQARLSSVRAKSLPLNGPPRPLLPLARSSSSPLIPPGCMPGGRPSVGFTPLSHGVAPSLRPTRYRGVSSLQRASALAPDLLLRSLDPARKPSPEPD